MKNFLISTLSLLSVSTVNGVPSRNYSVITHLEIPSTKIDIDEYQKTTKLYHDVEEINSLGDNIDKELRIIRKAQKDRG